MTIAVSAMAVTWSDGALHTAIKMNVTDTSSNAASLLMDLQVAATSKFQVDKNGKWSDGANFKLGWDGSFGGLLLRDAADSVFTSLYAGALVARIAAGAQFVIGTSESTFTDSAANQVLCISSPGYRFGGLAVNSAGHLQFSSTLNATGTPDAGFSRNAAGIIEVNNGTTGILRDITLRDLFTNDASFLLRTTTTITGGATGNVPTLSAGPVTGNPTKWLGIDDNGTTRYVPAW